MNTARLLASSLLLICLLLPGRAAAQDQDTVLFFNSYHQSYDWVSRYMAAFMEEFGSRAGVITFDLDTKRLRDEDFPIRVRQGLRLLDRIQPDLVITADDNAAKLLGPYILSRGYPLVYMGINQNPRVYLGDNPLATGVIERPLLKRNILFMQDIFGEDFKKCLVLLDQGTTSNVICDIIFKNRSSIRLAGIVVDLAQTNDWREWQDIVLTARDNGYQAIILGLYHRVRDEDGNIMPDQDVVRWTCANAKVPPFGFWTHNVGEGMAVGGLVLSPAPQGREAARFARRILDGKSPEDLLPTLGDQGRFVFSRSGMQIWNIILPQFIRDQAQFVD